MADNKGSRWSEKDDTDLMSDAEKKELVGDIAKKLGRSIGSVKARLLQNALKYGISNDMTVKMTFEKFNIDIGLYVDAIRMIANNKKESLEARIERLEKTMGEIKDK